MNDAINELRSARTVAEGIMQIATARGDQHLYDAAEHIYQAIDAALRRLGDTKAKTTIKLDTNE